MCNKKRKMLKRAAHATAPSMMNTNNTEVSQNVPINGGQGIDVVSAVSIWPSHLDKPTRPSPKDALVLVSTVPYTAPLHVARTCPLSLLQP